MPKSVRSSAVVGKDVGTGSPARPRAPSQRRLDQLAATPASPLTDDGGLRAPAGSLRPSDDATRGASPHPRRRGVIGYRRCSTSRSTRFEMTGLDTVVTVQREATSSSSGLEVSA